MAKNNRPTTNKIDEQELDKVAEFPSDEESTATQNEVVDTKEDDIQDVNMGYVQKARFRFDGDPKRILELNINDIGIISRLEAAEKELIAIATSVKENNTETGDDIEDIKNIGNLIREADAKVRTILDELFEANVSEVCAPSGTMFDPVKGKLRFEHIIDTLIGLYDRGLGRELSQISARSKEYTKKYTRKSAK